MITGFPEARFWTTSALPTNQGLTDIQTSRISAIAILRHLEIPSRLNCVAAEKPYRVHLGY